MRTESQNCEEGASDGGKATAAFADDKPAETAVRGSDSRFQAAVEAVNGFIWTNDPDGQMLGEQPGWAALTGQRFDEYQGYGWAAAVHPEDPASDPREGEPG